jgi:hypothetical protein
MAKISISFGVELLAAINVDNVYNIHARDGQLIAQIIPAQLSLYPEQLRLRDPSQSLQ